MKLAHVVTRYTAFKRSLGMRFAQSKRLAAFCRFVGDITLAQVDSHRVEAFINGQGNGDRSRDLRYSTLKGFYCYALARGYAASSPLPPTSPKRLADFVPYVYSEEELQRLLNATEYLKSPQSPLQDITFRTLLLVLYGTALRISEALALKVADVDLQNRVLSIQDAKFYKARWVPFGPRLAEHLKTYRTQRLRLPSPLGQGSAFLCTRTGQALTYWRALRLFHRLRRQTGLVRQDGCRHGAPARYQPRLHDIRHASAVHRLVGWYRQGADVQRLLPKLSTYLGHVNVVCTQRYLSMTPDLLQEASRRFQHYAFPEVNHVR